jgi:feruloyl-CoA synthase
MSGSPVRKVPLGAADVEIERRTDGSVRLRSPHALGAYPAKLSERLVHGAREAPDRAFIAQREAGGASQVQALGAGPPWKRWRRR